MLNKTYSNVYVLVIYHSDAQKRLNSGTAGYQGHLVHQGHLLQGHQVQGRPANMDRSSRDRCVILANVMQTEDDLQDYFEINQYYKVESIHVNDANHTARLIFSTTEGKHMLNMYTS